MALGLAYRFPALSVAGASLASPWLRFHIPLIKPGGPFSGTRLSDKALLHLLLHTFAHETIAVTFAGAGRVPASGAGVGLGTGSCHFPAP